VIEVKVLCNGALPLLRPCHSYPGRVSAKWPSPGNYLVPDNEGSGPVQVRSAEAGRLSMIGFRSAIALPAEGLDLAASQVPSIEQLLPVLPLTSSG
jgi:hypothetical protein